MVSSKTGQLQGQTSDLLEHFRVWLILQQLICMRFYQFKRRQYLRNHAVTYCHLHPRQVPFVIVQLRHIL